MYCIRSASRTACFSPVRLRTGAPSNRHFVAFPVSAAGKIAVASSSSSSAGGAKSDGSSAAGATTAPAERTLGLLTFDLDDTLFPTSRVVSDANDKMIERMRALGCETTVPEFLDTTRRIRRGLGGAPITYTGLRKLAIEAELVSKRRRGTRKTPARNDDGGDDPEESVLLASYVEDCYGVWERERHAAAERYLFDSAISALKDIKREFPGVCVAAVTNGKGNPLFMASTLAPHFDFCVSGEDPDVFPNRKPHPGIYEAVMDKYRRMHPDRQGKNEGEMVWCHVGDCLANDVGASADCGAAAIWLCPEEEEEEDVGGTGGKVPAAAVSSTSGGNPSWSTATENDRKERAELAAAAKNKVAARITCLSQLRESIADLLAP